jgi:hypothetical protein
VGLIGGIVGGGIGSIGGTIGGDDPRKQYLYGGGSVFVAGFAYVIAIISGVL